MVERYPPESLVSSGYQKHYLRMPLFLLDEFGILPHPAAVASAVLGLDPQVWQREEKELNPKVDGHRRGWRGWPWNWFR